jgi:hypothetical protein
MSTDLSVRNATGAQQRASDALLRCLGGTTVLLRLPTNVVANSDAQQLGQVTPTYEDIPLSPAIFRRLRPEMRDGKVNRYEVLISASAIEAQLGLLEIASTDQLFTMACGVFVDGELMPIEAAAEAEAFGTPYLYRLILRGPQSESL